MMKNLSRQLSVLFVTFLATTAFAAPIYEGYLTDPNSGNPILGPLDLKIDVKNPANTCILYSEKFTVSPDAANGYFWVELGQGTVLDKTKWGIDSTTVTTPVYSVDDAFKNMGAFGNTASCPSYSPGFADARNLWVSFSTNSGGTWDTAGSIAIKPHSYAMTAGMAINANSVGGFAPENLLRISAGTAPVLTAANVSELVNLVSGSSALYAKSSASGGISVPTGAPAAPSPGQMWYEVSSGQMKYFNGTVIIPMGGGNSVSTINAGAGLVSSTTSGVVNIALGAELNGLNTLSGTGFIQKIAAGNYMATNIGGDANITPTGVLTLSSTGVAAGTYAKVTVDSKGRVTAGSTSVFAGDLVSTATGNPRFLPINGCTASQSLSYSSITDTLVCSDILIGALSADTLLHISASGNDTSGDGSTTAPFATIAKALDKLPKQINAIATIKLLSQITQNESIIVQKSFGPNGKLIFSGGVSTNVITTNATTAGNAPLFVVSGVGISGGLSPSVQFENISVVDTNETSTGHRQLFMVMGGTALFTNISITGCKIGIAVNNGFIMMAGDSTISLAAVNDASAINVEAGGSVNLMDLAGLGANLTVNMASLPYASGSSSSQSGINVESGGSFKFESGSLTINMGPTAGGTNGPREVALRASNGGLIKLRGTTIIDQNTSGVGNNSLEISGGTISSDQSGSLTINNAFGESPVQVVRGGILDWSSPFTVNASSNNPLMRVESGSKAIFAGNVNLKNTITSYSLIDVREGSLFKFAPYSSASFTVDTTSNQSTNLFNGEVGAIINFGGSGINTYILTKVTYLASLSTASSMVTNGADSNTTSGTANANIPSAVFVDPSSNFINNTSTTSKWGPASKSGLATAVIQPAHGVKTFTTAGSWTVPGGITSLKVTIIGGGGPAGTMAGGRGGKAFFYLPVDSTVSSITVAIGSAGANATAGGTSSFTYGNISVSASGGGAGTSTSMGSMGSVNIVNPPAGAITPELISFDGIYKYGEGGQPSQFAAQPGFVMIEY